MYIMDILFILGGLAIVATAIAKTISFFAESEES